LGTASDHAVIAVSVVALAAVMWGRWRWCVGQPACGAPVAVAAASSYYVFVLTNVADPGNIWVGQVSDLAGKNTCNFVDGGLCAGAAAPMCCHIHRNLGPYATCAAASPPTTNRPDAHPAFGGTKVYIFGGSYFIDNMVDGARRDDHHDDDLDDDEDLDDTTTRRPPPSRHRRCRCSRRPLHHARRADGATSARRRLAPHKALSAARSRAREDLVPELLVADLFCASAGCLRRDYFYWVSVDYAYLCPVALHIVIDTLVQIHDPPAAALRRSR